MPDAYLLDTHTFLWLMFGSEKLSKKVRTIFADEGSTFLLSVASVWEIALKADKGKIVAPADLVDDAITAFRIEELPVRTGHVRRASQLPAVPEHKDPFDRLIAAQAIFEQPANNPGRFADAALSGPDNRLVTFRRSCAILIRHLSQLGRQG